MALRHLLAAASLALASMVGAASATTVFDLTGTPSSTAISFSDTVDGITVTATGERNDGGCIVLPFCTFFQPETVSQNVNGLGVDGGLLDNSQLDGQIDERLTFTFDQAVRLISVTFTLFTGNDAYDVYVDVGNGLTDVALGSDDNPFFFADDTIGTMLRIAVTGNASEFRVSSITVAAVPLPAGGLLLLGGLAGLAALRRRRNAV